MKSLERLISCLVTELSDQVGMVDADEQRAARFLRQWLASQQLLGRHFSPTHDWEDAKRALRLWYDQHDSYWS